LRQALSELPWHNLGTAPGQRHFAFEKLEYQLEEEFGCGIRPAVKAAPRSILGQSPSQVLGLFFTFRGNSFLRPLAAVSLRLDQTPGASEP